MSHGARVVLVGAGGLGGPVLSVLAASGLRSYRVIDDDVVDATNLHRQVLFDETQLGAPKARAAAESLRRRFRALDPSVEVVEERFVPENARRLARGASMLVDGTDNLASKFLVADTARHLGIPAVHAGVIAWGGWALAVGPRGTACLRCLFEEPPAGREETCATAGVFGPVVGVVGGLEGWLALRRSRRPSDPALLATYDGSRGTLRTRPLRSRPGCSLCASATSRDVATTAASMEAES